ncbi:rRNA cytosine-C5-methylase, partial [Endobacter medicaginis]|nr:rRNA cytosine-C5-methylase [Endobacter medicaginis]
TGRWTRTRIDAAMLSALGLGGLEAAMSEHGALRTDPGLWAERGGMDGFFIALLTRQ